MGFHRMIALDRLRDRQRARRRVVQIARNLDATSALRDALEKSPGDFRAFSYCRATGKATLT